MLPSASALASRREERVQKAFSVDHHGPGDARLSHRATAIYGEHSDYVARRPPVSRLGFVTREGWPGSRRHLCQNRERVRTELAPTCAHISYSQPYYTLLVLYRYTSPSPSVLCLSFHLVLSRDPRRTLSKSRVRKYRTPPGREVKIMRSST